MAQKKQDNIIDTIKEYYVSAIVGLIIVILGFGYIYSTLKNRNTITKNDTQTEITQEDNNQSDTISGRTYKVQKGDTLWKIAEKKYQSGYNYSDIVTANKLKNENSIEVGQVLTLPDVPAKKITVGKITPTTVKTTPTVTTKPSVAPSATLTPSVTVAPSTKPSVEPTKAELKQDKGGMKKTVTTINGTSYTIQKGDSLWTISVRAYGDGYKWTEIWKANKKMISNPNLIFAGNKLVLPR